MDIDKEQQARAMAKAKQSLLQAEIKREEARLNQGSALFLQEKFDTLLNDEFAEKLASHIIKLYRGEQRKTAIHLLEKLEKSICDESLQIRERSLIVIMLLSEHIHKNNIRELSALVARMSASWLYFETEYIAGFEPVCLQLQRIIVEMLATEQWYEVEQLIVTINKISSKTLLKNNLIQGVVSRVHDKLAEPEVLDIMVNAYLGESSQRKDVVENILINMGRQGTRFLIDRLTYSNSKEERLALVDLIPRIGEVSIPVLSRYLQAGLPWFVTRNIIMIISRLGDDNLYKDVRQHLNHEDIRVQQQVINCIEVLGGEKMRPRLLEALFVVNDELKAHLIDQLVQYKGDDIETSLLDLFDKRDNFSSHVHDFLITKLCTKLTAYSSPRATNSLLALIEEREERYGKNDSLVRTASQSLSAIEQKISDEDMSSVTEADQAPGFGGDEDLTQLVDYDDLTRIAADPSDLADLFSDGGLSDIFVETLTDTLTDKSGPVPSQEQDSSFEPHLSQDHHLMVWSSFYEQLDTAEANSFFAILEPMTLEADEKVVQQGDKLSDIIFIDHGYADLVFSTESGNILFSPIQGGEIVGCEGFFEDRIWTLTIQAQTELQVRLLKRDRFAEIEDKVPALKTKLETYCRRHDVLPYLIRCATGNSPEATDHPIEIESSLVFKDSKNTVVNHIIASLGDTSHGGFSVVLPYANMENVSACLGHQVSAVIETQDGSPHTCFGIIAGGGIYDRFSETLHLHIKLYHPQEEKRFICKSIHIM